jgi:hypothetical protein
MLRLIDRIKNVSRASQDGQELAALTTRLRRHADRAEEIRKGLLLRVVTSVFSEGAPESSLVSEAVALCTRLLAFEGLFSVPDLDGSPPRTTTEVWERTAFYRTRLAPLSNRRSPGRSKRFWAI